MNQSVVEPVISAMRESPHISRPSFEDLRNWFAHHPPLDAESVARYQFLREGGRVLSELVLQLCPESADRTTAIRCVREAVMWANASIACGGK
jgi:hypothetical protein